MDDDKKDGFKDKIMDQKLSVVPTPVELAEKRRAANNAAASGHTSSEQWHRQCCVSSMVDVGVTDPNKIVSGAKILYDYVVEGKMPPEDAPKGTSFHIKGGPRIP